MRNWINKRAEGASWLSRFLADILIATAVVVTIALLDAPAWACFAVWWLIYYTGRMHDHTVARLTKKR